MRVIKYDTRLSDDKLPFLIRDRATNYAAGSKQLNTPRDVYFMLTDLEDTEHLDSEKVWLFCLDNKLKLIGYFLISKGSVNTSLVSSRSIFIRALAVGATSIILAHNHPSGDPTPSEEDINVTKRLVECGKLLEIPLNDHVIVGDRSYWSAKEGGILQ